MEDFKLNLRQKKLLEQLAELKKKGRLIEPINPFPLGPMNYVIYLKSRYNLRLQWISDLDILSVAGYINFEWNRTGLAKLYRVSELGLSVLNDPAFITAADYKQANEGGEPFSLVSDSTEHPPLTESVQELLYADFRRLTDIITESPEDFLDPTEAEGIDRDIKKVLCQLDLNHPIHSEVIKGVDAIGRRLQKALSQHIGSAKGRAASQTLAAYGLWSARVHDEITGER